jgi:hypothetical protein
MFTKSYKFNVDTHSIIDFVRVLGRIGLKFDIGDERCVADKNDPDKKTRYRTFVVYAKWKEIEELMNLMDIIATYQQH